MSDRGEGGREGATTCARVEKQSSQWWFYIFTAPFMCARTLTSFFFPLMLSDFWPRPASHSPISFSSSMASYPFSFPLSFLLWKSQGSVLWKASFVWRATLPIFGVSFSPFPFPYTRKKSLLAHREMAKEESTFRAMRPQRKILHWSLHCFHQTSSSTTSRYISPVLYIQGTNISIHTYMFLHCFE